MMVDDLLKNTWEHHPDFQALEGAKRKISALALYINNQKKDLENILKVRDISKLIVGLENKVLLIIQE